MRSKPQSPISEKYDVPGEKEKKKLKTEVKNRIEDERKNEIQK